MSRELVLVPREKFQKMLKQIETHNEKDDKKSHVENMSKDIIDSPQATGESLETSLKSRDQHQFIPDDKQASVDESRPPHSIVERWGVKRSLEHFVKRKPKRIKRRKWSHLAH